MPACRNAAPARLATASLLVASLAVAGLAVAGVEFSVSPVRGVPGAGWARATAAAPRQTRVRRVTSAEPGDEPETTFVSDGGGLLPGWGG